jgi:hypothetical protein
MGGCKLFRQNPPWHLVINILYLLNIPIDLPCTFFKSDISLVDSSEAAGLLEPYYIPCKAMQFLEYTDERRWITILRHILDPHGWEVVAKETTRGVKKVMFYTIQRNANTVVDTIHVDFS